MVNLEGIKEVFARITEIQKKVSTFSANQNFSEVLKSELPKIPSMPFSPKGIEKTPDINKNNITAANTIGIDESNSTNELDSKNIEQAKIHRLYNEAKELAGNENRIPSTKNVNEIKAVENNSTNDNENRYNKIIKSASMLYDVPENLIKAIIKQESNFNPKDVSHAGASGLMQLMPGTAASVGVKNIFDPVENVLGGTKHFKDLLKQLDGNIELSLAAYNAGMGRVKSAGGIPHIKETQEYVKAVMNYFNKYNNDKAIN